MKKRIRASVAVDCKALAVEGTNGGKKREFRAILGKFEKARAACVSSDAI